MKEYLIAAGDGRSVPEMAHALEKWLKDKNMDTCVFHLENGGYAVHARHRNSCVLKLIGMDAALAVELEPVSADRVRMAVGSGLWKDKLAAGAASLLLLWPLAFTSVCGAVRQKLLIVRADRFIRNYDGA